jgi:hypothetical protein
MVAVASEARPATLPDFLATVPSAGMLRSRCPAQSRPGNTLTLADSRLAANLAGRGEAFFFLTHLRR